MATMADKFVPVALQECAEITRKINALQAAAVSLKARYASAGGATMAGIDAFDFTAYGITKDLFTAAMTDLGVAHNAVALSTIMTNTAYDAIVKVGNGA
jgi:hypothetical protein